MPEEIRCPNGSTADARTALCMLLRRLAYPIQGVDVEMQFGWEASRYLRVSQATASFLWD